MSFLFLNDMKYSGDRSRYVPIHGTVSSNFLNELTNAFYSTYFTPAGTCRNWQKLTFAWCDSVPNEALSRSHVKHCQFLAPPQRHVIYKREFINVSLKFYKSVMFFSFWLLTGSLQGLFLSQRLACLASPCSKKKIRDPLMVLCSHMFKQQAG